MRQAEPQRVLRVRAALALSLISIVVTVLPAAGTAPWGASELVALSLVMLALAATVGGAAPRVLAIIPGLGRVSPLGGESPAPVTRTRATDPTHQPLSPRAPGLV